jgi:hypothetical protein
MKVPRAVLVAPAGVPKDYHPTDKQGAVFVAPDWLLDDSQNNEPAVLDYISVYSICSNKSMGCLGTGPVCLETLEAFHRLRPDVELTPEKLCEYVL